MKKTNDPISVTSRLLQLALPVVALCFFSSSLQAVDGSWNVDNGGLWSDQGNWDNGGPNPPGTEAGDVVNITRPYDEASTTVRRIDVDGDYIMGTLSVGTANGYYEVRGLTGNTLTMDNDGDQAVINLKAGSPGNIIYFSGVNLRLTEGGLRIYKESSGSNHYVGTSNGRAFGTIANTTNDLQWLTLESAVGAGGNFQVLSTISDGKTEDRPDAQLAVLVDLEAGAIAFLGTGTSVNTFSGGVVFRNGQLKGNNVTAFGTGVLTLGDSLTSAHLSLTSQTNGAVYANDIVVSSQAHDDYNITIHAPLNNARVEYSGAVDVQRRVIFSHSQANTHLVFSGALSGNGALTVTGSGTASLLNTGAVELSGNNASFSGGITMTSNMRLILGHQNALGTGKLTMGTSQSNALKLDASSDVNIATGNDIDWKVDITFLGSNNLNLGSGNVELGRISGATTSRKVTVMDSVLGFNGAISSTLGLGLTKDGEGILELNGVNTYAGPTLIEAGTLQGNGSLVGNLTIELGATLSTNRVNYTTDTLDVAGSLLLDTGSIFEFVYDSSLLGAAGVTADGVSLDGAILQLLDLSFGTVAKDTVFTVIENTSGNAITGTFADLDEGALITVGAQSFLVSYAGGSGNDFTLTAIPEPSTVALLAGVGLAGVAWLRRRKR